MYINVYSKCHLQGKSADIACRIREKVCEVLPCDMYSSYPLGKEIIHQFDVVTCQLILESCCRTKEMYKTAATNLSRLVKPGGRLVMQSVLGSEHYMVQNHKMPTLPVDITFVESVFKSNGFKNIAFHICEAAYSAAIAVNKGIYIMHALKCLE